MSAHQKLTRQSAQDVTAKSKTPNLDKLEAVLRALGSSPSVSFQQREYDATGFFTVTAGGDEKHRCAIGQGDTLAAAVDAMQRDYAAMRVRSSVAPIERAAA